jgi:hypothetical protein
MVSVDVYWFSSDNFFFGQAKSFLLNPTFLKNVCFKDQTTLLIADEKTKNGGMSAVTFSNPKPNVIRASSFALFK